MARKPRVRLVLTNRRAWRALEVIAETLIELRTDLPWRDDVKRAKRACRYALQNLGLIEDDDGDDDGPSRPRVPRGSPG